MWVRKSKYEIVQEQNSRKRKWPYFLLAFIIGELLFGYFTIVPIVNSGSLRPDLVTALLFLLWPVIAYSSYRQYVIYGDILSTNRMVYLACGRGIGYEDQGWAFKVYGKTKPKWYQVRGCETPDHCDIAYQHEVGWIEER